MDTVRDFGVGGVLLLESTAGFMEGLDGVEDVAEIVRVRTIRLGEGPGLRLVRLTLGGLGLRRGTGGEDEVVLGPALGGLMIGLGGSAFALRLLSAVADGLGPIRVLSPGFSFLCHSRSVLHVASVETTY